MFFTRRELETPLPRTKPVLPLDNDDFIGGISILVGMRGLLLLGCIGIASAKVTHVPIKSGAVLMPNEAYTLNVDASEPAEIGWLTVQAKPCTTNCVQVTEFRKGLSYSTATKLGSSQKYRPTNGKISVEYKNVSAEPVTIDVFRIERTCDAEACRFIDPAQKARTLVFLVDEFKSITTSKDGSYSVISGSVVSGRPFRIKAVWWTEEKTQFMINCAPFVQRFLDNHTPKEKFRPYVIAGQAIGEGNNIVLKSIGSCAPKASHYGASPDEFFK
jgi:hypothetical protein